MNYKELNGKTIREGFMDFHKENPQIYREFKKQAFRAILNDKKKISAKLIINFIRWNHYLNTTDENFKINDAYQSYYARLFVAEFPEHESLFNFRKLRNEEPGPYMVNQDGQITFC